jgi:hypothetical protein
MQKIIADDAQDGPHDIPNVQGMQIVRSGDNFTVTFLASPGGHLETVSIRLSHDQAVELAEQLQEVVKQSEP